MTATVDLAQRGVKTAREIRQFTVSNIDVRANNGSDTLTLTGFACVTGVSYPMQDMLGTYDELVEPKAFKRTLANRDDVRLLVNHDGIPLARTKSGTLRLTEIVDKANDPLGQGTTGLWTEADLEPRSGLVNDIRSAMERGDLDEMSFAFQVTKQEWSPDFQQRNIQEVKLFDVSVVTYPANPATSAQLRGVEALDALDDDEARVLLGRLQKRFEHTPTSGGKPLYVAKAELLGLR